MMMMGYREVAVPMMMMMLDYREVGALQTGVPSPAVVPSPPVALNLAVAPSLSVRLEIPIVRPLAVGQTETEAEVFLVRRAVAPPPVLRMLGDPQLAPPRPSSTSVL